MFNAVSKIYFVLESMFSFWAHTLNFNHELQLNKLVAQLDDKGHGLDMVHLADRERESRAYMVGRGDIHDYCACAELDRLGIC